MNLEKLLEDIIENEEILNKIDTLELNKENKKSLKEAYKTLDKLKKLYSNVTNLNKN